MKYMVINNGTGISVELFDNKKYAQTKADWLTTYHNELFVVKEV